VSHVVWCKIEAFVRLLSVSPNITQSNPFTRLQFEKAAPTSGCNSSLYALPFVVYFFGKIILFVSKETSFVWFLYKVLALINFNITERAPE
jgi:hypothetical protein